MSKPATIYRIQHSHFHETADVQVYTDISDMDNLVDDADPQTVIELEGAGGPLDIEVIDNNEDPFTVIKAQQATIRFKATSAVGMNTFSSGSDNRWFVHVYITDDTKTEFKGFLNLDNNQEPHMPWINNVITLIATDGLGLLKNVQLQKPDETIPTSYNRIATLLAYALRQTGMDLMIRAAFNIKRSVHTTDIRTLNVADEHFFTRLYLFSRTFEGSEVGTTINAYEAIERILGCEARLFQYQGMWWIVRVDEIEDLTRGLYVTQFLYDGTFYANLGEYHFDKQIKKDLPIYFSEGATIAKNERATKSLKLRFDLDTWAENPCNKDFVRGDLFDVVSPTEKRFTPECWTLRAGFPTGYIGADSTTAYIHRKYNSYGYESARYMVLTPRTTQESGSVQPTYIESEGIPVHEKDKFTASVDWRLNLGIATGGGDFRLFRFVLHGDDGSYWILGRDTDTGGSDESLRWYNTAAWTANTARGKTTIDYDIMDEEAWNTISYDAPPIPVDGTLYIWLNQFNQFVGSDDNKEIWYSNLQFEYLAYINETYRKVRAQEYATSQSINTKKTITRPVYMSDSPKKIFKGALFYLDGSTYRLENSFYNAAVFPTGPPSSDYIHTFGEIQLFDVWNQFNRDMKVLEASVQGMDLDLLTTENYVDSAHLVGKWYCGDLSLNVVNRFFNLLTFRKDYRSGGWKGTFREVVNTTINKDYTSHTFKYIEQ